MIAVKVMASVLVLASTLGLSQMAISPYQLRVRTLEEWLRFLSHLNPLIQWKRVPLPQALLQAALGQRLLLPALQDLQQELDRREIAFEQTWQAMLSQLPGLWEDDRRVLADLGRALGMSDVQYQHDHLAAAHAELERLLKDAREERSKDGRLLGALFSALGVMVIILML
jgi:stage III sporulation protein AB